MTYATQQGLVDRFGETELVQLSDRDGDRQADAEVVARALEDADAEIDAYLASRYALPLASVPDRIAAIAHDIARHALMKGAGIKVELIVDSYRDAIGFLKDLAAGRAQLDLPPSGTASPTSGGPDFSGPGRTFTDETLKGY